MDKQDNIWNKTLNPKLNFLPCCETNQRKIPYINSS